MKTFNYNNRIKRSKKEVLLRILIAVVFLFIIFFLAKAVGTTFLRIKEVAIEKAKIEAEIKSLEIQRSDLEAKIKLYQNLDFLEKEARLKFNLQKEGEQAVVILPNEEEKPKIIKPATPKTWLEKIKDWFKRD